VARDAEAPGAPQRDAIGDWLAALESAGLPVAWTDGAKARPRISFGASLPAGMAAEADLVDVVTTERWPAWRVRAALADRLPVGWRLVDVEDVWLAGPPLAGRVAAADYRITLLADGLAPDPAAPDAGALSRAAGDVLAATAIRQERSKGTTTVSYDLRPLLIDVRVAEPGPPTVLVARTRFHPELGTGRPEAVVAALGERTGRGLAIDSVVRERLLLAEDLA
jgi:radical SAM-linked protein